MERYASWFRPRLDDLGAWPALELDDDEMRPITELSQSSGARALDVLLDDYGSEPLSFGASSLVDRMTRTIADESELVRMAMTIAALDYYRTRAKAPRAAVGGLTRPSNQARWKELRPYLVTRLHDVLNACMPGSLLSRAIYVTTANNLRHDRVIERRLKRQLDDAKMFASVEVDVETASTAMGGAARLDDESRDALEVAKRSLADDEPVLLEIVRDPVTSPMAAQLVVAFLIEEPQPGQHRLYCYDPARPDGPVTLEAWSISERLRFYDADPQVDAAAPRGLRLIEVPEAEPPAFGLRRYIRHLLPWRLFWWVRRWIKTLAIRSEEKQYRTASWPRSSAAQDATPDALQGDPPLEEHKGEKQ